MPVTTRQKQQTIYIPPTLLEQAKEAAKRNKRSLNSQLIYSIEQQLRREREAVAQETSR